MIKGTKFDNKKALIIGSHPHEGATSICKGISKTSVGWGLVFENTNTEEQFFIFNPENIKWV